jgi:hypothetical protein
MSTFGLSIFHQTAIDLERLVFNDTYLLGKARMQRVQQVVARTTDDGRGYRNGHGIGLGEPIEEVRL